MSDLENDCYMLEPSEPNTCSDIEQALSAVGRCHSLKQDSLLHKLFGHFLPSAHRQETASVKSVNPLDRSSACSANCNSNCSIGELFCRGHCHRLSHTLENSDKENGDGYSTRLTRPVQEMLHHVASKCKETLDCRPYQGPKTPPSPKCLPKCDPIWANDTRPTTQRGCCCPTWSTKQLQALLLCLLDEQMELDSSLPHLLHRVYRCSSGHFCTDPHERSGCANSPHHRPSARTSNSSGNSLESRTNCTGKCQCLFTKYGSHDQHRFPCSSRKFDQLAYSPRNEGTYPDRSYHCRDSSSKSRPVIVSRASSRRSSRLAKPMKEVVASRPDHRNSLNHSDGSYAKRMRERRTRSISLTPPVEISYHNESHRSEKSSEVTQQNEVYGTKFRLKEFRMKHNVSPCRWTSKTDGRYSSSRGQNSTEAWMHHHQTHSPQSNVHHYRASHCDQRRLGAFSHLSNHYRGPPSVYDIACSYNNQPIIADSPQSPEHSRKGCHDPMKVQPFVKLIRSRAANTGLHKRIGISDYRSEKIYHEELSSNEDHKSQKPRRLQSVVCSRPEKRQEHPVSPGTAQVAGGFNMTLKETENGQDTSLLTRKSPVCQRLNVSSSDSASDNESDSTTNTDDSSGSSSSSGNSSDSSNSHMSLLDNRSEEKNASRIDPLLTHQDTNEACVGPVSSSRSGSRSSSTSSNYTSNSSNTGNTKVRNPENSQITLMREHSESNFINILPVAQYDPANTSIEHVVSDEIIEMPREFETLISQTEEEFSEIKDVSKDAVGSESIEEALHRQDSACGEKIDNMIEFTNVVDGDQTNMSTTNTTRNANLDDQIGETAQVRLVNLVDEFVNEQMKPENISPGYSSRVAETQLCDVSQCEFSVLHQDGLDDAKDDQRSCTQEPSVSSTCGVKRSYAGGNESCCSSKSDADTDEVAVKVSSNDPVKKESSTVPKSPRKEVHNDWHRTYWRKFSKRQKRSSRERYMVHTNTLNTRSHGFQDYARNKRGREDEQEWMANLSKEKLDGEEGEIFSDCTTEVDEEAIDQNLYDNNQTISCPNVVEEGGQSVRRPWETSIPRKRQGERLNVYYRRNGYVQPAVNDQVDRNKRTSRQFGRYYRGNLVKALQHTPGDLTERSRPRPPQQLHRNPRGDDFYTKYTREGYTPRSLRPKRLGSSRLQARPVQLHSSGTYVSVRSAPRGRLFSLVGRPNIGHHGLGQPRYAVLHSHVTKYTDRLRYRWDSRAGLPVQTSGQHRNRPPPVHHYQAIVSEKRRRSLERRNN